MKKKVIISIFILIVISCTTLISASPISPRFGIISGMEGNVEMRIKYKLFGFISIPIWWNLKGTEKLNEGDMIRTGPDGILELTFNDNIYVKVDNNSWIVIGENEILEQGRNSSIILNRGRVWAKVKKIYQELTNFEVITPSAVAGVRGTLFSVYTNGEETTLSVKEGAVDLSSRDGEDNKLVIREQMGAATKGKVTLKNKISNEENNKWENKEVEEWLEKNEIRMEDNNEVESNSPDNANQVEKANNSVKNTPPDHVNQGGKANSSGNNNPPGKANQVEKANNSGNNTPPDHANQGGKANNSGENTPPDNANQEKKANDSGNNNPPGKANQVEKANNPVKNTPPDHANQGEKANNSGNNNPPGKANKAEKANNPGENTPPGHANQVEKANNSGNNTPPGHAN